MLLRTFCLLLALGLALPGRPAAAQQCPLQAPPFAGHAFPPQAVPAAPGDFQLVDAFPALVFDQPVFLTFAPDGSDRIFVVERAGRIRVFPNSATASSTSLFLDITGRVQSNGGEQGLLGLAFDPAYATNGLFYVAYTASAPNCSGGLAECDKVVRFRVSSGDPNRADVNSALDLLQFFDPDNDHNGGMLAFGPDGLLYIASGDGGDFQDFNAQDLGVRLGKLLRIDPRAAAPYIPPGNPFAADPTKAREIWLYGLRNPWRFSFDRTTGDLWIGDVGETQFEEIDFLPAGHAGGVNLGWNRCEGNHDYAGSCAALGAMPPVYEYSHQSGMGTAVVGGYVYRGAASPLLTGMYLFGDATSGRVFAWDRAAAPIDVGNVPALSSFGEDQQGEIYALGLFDGAIRRVTQSPGGGTGGLPARLSQTRLFSNVATLTPAAGMVEYGVAVPFWSDNASKRRWIALPAGARAAFDALAAWDLPVGTALVKHFEVPIGSGLTRRLETRVLLRQAGSALGPARWIGMTYRWNASQTDADLLTSALDEQISLNLGSGTQQQSYHYPAPFECLQCHNAAAGGVLGLRTAQMNRSWTYTGGAANQLSAWACAGLLDRDPGDPAVHDTLVDPTDGSAALTPRARAWLDVNCSMCHRPAGLAPGGMDLRRQPLLGGMNAIGVAPTQGGLGLVDPRRIFAGRKEQSVLWARVQSAQVGVHMPPQGRAVDPLGVSLLGSWIDTSLFSFDSDADGRADTSDNCPYVANDQRDSGGVGLISGPDGIGDTCQCGDLWNDGRVTSVDVSLLRRSLTDASFPNPGLCNVIEPASGPKGRCDLADVVALARALAHVGPGLAPVCRAAGGAP